jgi:hypothetical protein
MFDAYIKAAPPDWIAQPPLFIAREHDKRRAFALDCSEFRDGDLICRCSLEEHGLNAFGYLIEFVDQEDARACAFQSSYQRSRSKELSTLKIG